MKAPDGQSSCGWERSHLCAREVERKRGEGAAWRTRRERNEHSGPETFGGLWHVRLQLSLTHSWFWFWLLFPFLLLFPWFLLRLSPSLDFRGCLRFLFSLGHRFVLCLLLARILLLVLRCSFTLILQSMLLFSRHVLPLHARALSRLPIAGFHSSRAQRTDKLRLLFTRGTLPLGILAWTVLCIRALLAFLASS